ncbi:DUF3558 domain-containing protein [Actinomycetospora sp. CA-101289]|uniref:DUF3558 domain-containing protein n=1 Tax=Actinomycetospora sp. CA-101289 TaxID=3239893 RepID=UPI003D97B8B7
MRRFSAVLVLLFLAGCTKTGAPQPVPPNQDRFGAPEVGTPRAIESFASNPCAALTREVWVQLGFAPEGRVESLSTGERSCVHEGVNRERYISMVVATTNDPLVGAYRARQFPIFRPVTVGGLPGVQEQSSASDLSCTLTVGTADDQGLLFNSSEYQSGSSGDRRDPCELGQRVAERIVAALPPLPGK